MTDTKPLSFNEYLSFLFLNAQVKARNFVDFAKVATRYYSNKEFRKIDLQLLSKYLKKSPFAISKEFLLSRGAEDVYAYGETPLLTLERIADRAGISSKDRVYELGCGRGRTCFWLHCFKKCHVVGIDSVPDFIEKANEVQAQLNVKDVQFLQEDLLNAELSSATVIYLYGTCYEEEFIRQLIEKFRSLPAGTKIITVSYSLNDFADEPIFEVMNRFPVAFTWGEGDVYIQKVK